MSIKSRAAAMFDSNDRATEMHLALGALVVLTFLFLEAWSVLVKNKDFDMQGFGIGIGAVFVATGVGAVAQGIQRRTQDGPVPPTA